MNDKYLLILLIFLFGFLNIAVLTLMIQAFKFDMDDLFKVSIITLVVVLVNYVALQVFYEEDDIDG